MNVTDVHNLGFRASEVAIFGVDQVPATHQEWSEAIGELNLCDLIGSVASVGARLDPHPQASYTMARHPQDGVARDWWAADHLWHLDGTRWDVQPTLTVIGCRQAEVGAPQTDLVDSVKLFEASLEDDFWQHHGLQPGDLPELQTEFLVSTYHTEAIPFLETFMTSQELEILNAITQQDLENSGCTTQQEFLDRMNSIHPAKNFSLIRKTPFSGLDSLFLDGGGRNSRLLGPDGEDFTAALHAFRLTYLHDTKLKYLGALSSVEWQPNTCLLFPQVGTLHRANPGNDHDRELHLGFLS